MSRRFGRNQRRRAREALAAASQRVADLEQAHVLDRALQEDMRTRLDALQSEIDDAKDIAGPMSILFPVEGNFQPGIKSEPVRQLHIDVPARLPDRFICDEPMETLTYQRLPLETLVLSIRPDVLNAALHVNVEFADGVWRYGLTRTAWYSLPRERRQRLIAQTIPNDLAREVAKHGFRL